MVKKILKLLIPERQRLALRYSFFKLRGLYYRGDAVTCPCCGGSFSMFLPYGVGADRRDNAL
ncbi:MAG: SAM-dependent methyltransferase, partial [Hymenobacteraceae bacterium]|nr:SAM-dependent methyltransferase [Hymenobacteraceae bacterium]MDX5396923.1 SAM-dependent methyltransferase [Hymenobacteraceae bacterium]MDX5512997.1 SAM-dependent methyltransferase [Hymenobacteraceae bacterium]